MTTFEQFNLPKSLQKAIDELGFVTPTPIQEKSFSVIMSGRDMMGIAQTGTGKTFAYLLPLLKLYKFTPTNTPKIVILVPTRELVVQVAEEIEKLTKYMSVKTIGIFGGVNINTQKKAVYEGIDILVGTPGRVMDLALDSVIRFDETQKLVIDEFDEMLNLGFRVQLTSILAMMNRTKRQNILFSATMTDEVDAILNDFFDFPEEVTLAASGTPLENIKQITYNVPNFNTKVNLLKHLLQTDESMERVLVFVNNKKISDMLYERIEEDFDGQFGVIHSNKSQNYRFAPKYGLFESKVNSVKRPLPHRRVVNFGCGYDYSQRTFTLGWIFPRSKGQLSFIGFYLHPPPFLLFYGINKTLNFGNFPTVNFFNNISDKKPGCLSGRGGRNV